MEPVVSGYSETEERNLRVVRQFFGEEPGPADKSELFAVDGAWWNGLPMIPGAEGVMEHRGRDAIRNILPSQSRGRGLLPGRDTYKLETCRATEVVTIADGEWVMRQQNMTAETKLGQHYANTYCFVFLFTADGQIGYLTEHWNTWQAQRVLMNNFEVEPARPHGSA